MNTPTQIDGTWNLVVGTPRGDRPVTLRLVTDGAAVSGTINHIAIEDAAWKDGTLTFGAQLAEPVKVKVRCTVTVDGDTMSGKAKVARLPLTVPVSGTREAA